MTTLIDVPPGLNGVAVTDTSIGDVDGDAGYFHYRGYDATELARHHSFEEAWHLVAIGRLPDAVELEAFRRPSPPRASCPPRCSRSSSRWPGRPAPRWGGPRRRVDRR